MNDSELEANLIWVYVNMALEQTEASIGEYMLVLISMVAQRCIRVCFNVGLYKNLN